MTPQRLAVARPKLFAPSLTSSSIDSPPPSPPPSPPAVDITMPVRPTVRHRHMPGNVATRRTVTKRDRAYAPGGRVIERVHVITDESGAPRPPQHAMTIAAIAHVAVCCVVAVVAVAGLGGFALALWGDVSRKTRARAARFVSAAEACVRDWEGNGCSASVPGRTTVLEDLCRGWAECIERGKFAEADAVSGTVWAEAVAEVVNAFANSVNSWSAVVAVGAAVVALGLAGNCALAGVRQSGHTTGSSRRSAAHPNSMEDEDHLRVLDSKWAEVGSGANSHWPDTLPQRPEAHIAVARQPLALLESGEEVPSTPKRGPRMRWMRPHKSPPWQQVT